MILNDCLLTYIKDEVGRVEFGRVIIELKGRGNKIDVITEHRKRFEDREKRPGR